MGVDADIKEIEEKITLISEKVDRIIYEQNMTALMALSDQSLKEILDDEPDEYSAADLKSAY